MKKFYYLITLLIVVACSSNSQQSSEVAKWEEQAANVTIIRDDFGVPHIYGKTDADAVFGMLYAQCEDDFKRVERNYIWAIGRLAEVEGEDALYSDVRARLFMTIDEAKAHYERSPEWLKKLCNAFADGVNYYLHTHPEVKPTLLTRFEPWMPMYFSEGSIGGDIERISTTGIKGFYENESMAYTLPKDDPTVEPKGSNGFAIAGDLTSSGNAMLLINPHTTFYFRGEVHMISEEGLNAYGAVTWGQFFIYQGFNEKTGWMHTSTYTDVMDEFIENVEERDGKLKYEYGEEWRDVWSNSVTLKYKTDDGVSEKSFDMYRTHHGPITKMIEDKWVASAMMWEPVKALEQSFTRTKKSNYDEFRSMMDIRTNSSNNTVFADAEGNIAYFHGNYIPIRDVQFDYSAPVDGTLPATDWQGVHEVDDCIMVLNPENGWIQNCNSTPFTSAGAFSPKKEDYPYYMATIPETFRGIHAQQVLEGVDSLTLDGLIDLAYDPYLPAFEQVISGLISAFDNNKASYPDLLEPILVLKEWDLRVSKESVGMSLAHYYGMQLYRNAKRPDGLRGMDRFNYYGTGLPETERLDHFTATVTRLNEDFGTWNTPWGTINRFQRLNGDIKVQFDDNQPSIPVGLSSGTWGALAAYGMRTAQTTKKIYGTRGNSFVAVVEFGDKVKAKSILAGGQSGDPASSHFDDQAQDYVDVKFKDVAFYRDDVERRAERTYRPGE
ncbi:MAG: acylase [Cyclobacteriaceae bacterium]